MVLSYIHADDTVIDIGVSPSFKDNANYFERLYNLPNKLTCLGLHADFSHFKKEFPDFNLVTFDGFQFPSFESKFDVAYSNTVIEHVGNYDQQLKWLSGIARICKTLVNTTPNRWLPFETHSMTFFIHWFPDNIRNAIYRKIGKAHYANDYMWLLGARDLKKMLREAGFDIVTFHKYRFLFFPLDFLWFVSPIIVRVQGKFQLDGRLVIDPCCLYVFPFKRSPFLARIESSPSNLKGRAATFKMLPRP